MRFLGLPLGWVVGMVLQIPLSLVIDSFDLTPLWWTVQLCGLLVVTIIAVVLDWKLVSALLKKHRILPERVVWKAKYGEEKNTTSKKSNVKSIGEWFNSQYKGFINWLNT